MATINSCDEVTASSGQILQGQGIGTASAFSTATYPSTATGINKILVADGTNWVASTPTFPNASATSRKIIVSDGTNWVASTETWATPGTSGNVLTSDGTNWTSAAPSGGSGIVTVSNTLTNSQIKALHATPITVLASQGAGKVIVFVNGTFKFNYGGNNAFTAGASQTISLYYGTAQSINAVISNSVLTGTTTTYAKIGLTSNLSGITTTNCENLALNFYNPVATEITGNAANDNTVTYSISYLVISI